MNTDVISENPSRYEKLAKPKTRVDRNSNYNAFKVKRSALSYQITNSLNKLAQPKRKQDFLNVTETSSRNTLPSTGKQGYHKLINSNEQSKDAQESRKKQFLLDTYARITAARNKNCSKRLNELAKPKRCYNLPNDAADDYDNYFQTIKKYNPKPANSFGNQTMKH